MTVRQTSSRNRIFRAVVAIAAGGMVLPAQALELGAANLRSALGERLLVEIPIASELPLPTACIDARVGTVGGILRPAGQRQLRGGIVLSTPRIVAEPMLALTVTIACPGLPRLTRDYTLFLDPAAPGGDRKPSVLNVANPARPVPATRREPPSVVARESVATTRRYRVKTGDTVSGIAAALTPPGQSYWPMVDRIVSANPSAFAEGDADRLLAGSTLTLPVPAPTVVPTSTMAPAQAAGRRSTDPGIAPAEPARATTIATSAATASDPAPRAVGPATAGRTETDRLLNVLNDTDARNPASADPFTETAAAAQTAAGSARADTRDNDRTHDRRVSWKGRLAGLAAGTLLALLGFSAWRRLIRPARRGQAAAALSGAATGNRKPLGKKPAPTSDPFELRDDLVPTGTFESLRHAEDDIEVGALETGDPATPASELDDETRQMLEADYEAEFTRTQLLEHEAAARALSEDTDPVHDVTIELPGYENASETAGVPADEAGLAQATEARYVDEAGEPGDTAAMPGLDLDLELPGMSMILESCGEALSEALGEDFEVEVDTPPRKRRA